MHEPRAVDDMVLLVPHCAAIEAREAFDHASMSLGAGLPVDGHDSGLIDPHLEKVRNREDPATRLDLHVLVLEQKARRLLPARLDIQKARRVLPARLDIRHPAENCLAAVFDRPAFEIAQRDDPSLRRAVADPTVGARPSTQPRWAAELSESIGSGESRRDSG